MKNLALRNDRPPFGRQTANHRAYAKRPNSVLNTSTTTIGIGIGIACSLAHSGPRFVVLSVGLSMKGEFLNAQQLQSVSELRGCVGGQILSSSSTRTRTRRTLLLGHGRPTRSSTSLCWTLEVLLGSVLNTFWWSRQPSPQRRAQSSWVHNANCLSCKMHQQVRASSTTQVAALV
jgi:hypothetical protein